MTSWSWERFWDAMESFRPLWYVLTAADLTFGLVAVVALTAIRFDSSNPAFVVVVLDLAIVAVTLVPLLYMLYRLRARERERDERRR